MTLLQLVMRMTWVFWLLPIAIFALFMATLSDVEIGEAWLNTEGTHVLTWWFIVTMAGIGAMPLMFRLLPTLADRGYGLSRLAGLLLTTFVLWFLTSLGLLHNSPGATTTAWIIVLLGGIWAWVNWQDRPSWRELRRWFQSHWPLMVVTEVLFFVALFGWAYLRAHNPELISTEKPMEMAFINGVRNSVTFPPKDPWLAGYGISYYYMGYVMVAIIADLSDVPTTLAFNLTGALVFALTATGALSVGYNLVRSVDRLDRWRGGGAFSGIGVGLLAAMLIVLSGNLGTPLVQLPYSGYDVPVVDDVVSDEYFGFWDVAERTGPYYLPVILEDGTQVYQLLDTNQIVSTPPPTHIRAPDRDGDGIADWDDDPPEDDDMGFWWWFRHSRLVHDRNLAGASIGYQPIAEFPQFSFLLADNHPHVLALPFTLLMLGLAISLALRFDALRPWEIFLYGIMAGGIIFLNAWDGIYLVILVGAEFLRRMLRNGTANLSGLEELWQIITLRKRVEINVYLIGVVWVTLFALIMWRGIADLGVLDPVDTAFQALLAIIIAAPLTLLINWLMTDSDWAGVLRFGIWLGLIFAVFYYPWTSSFASQANGFYPNVIFPTRSPQYFLQFGVFILLLTPFIIWQAIQARTRLSGFGVMTVVLAGLILLLSVPVASAMFIEANCPLNANGVPTDAVGTPETNWACQARAPLYGEISNAGASIVNDVFWRRTTALPSQIFMLLLLGIVVTRLFPLEPRQRESNREPYNYSPNTAIALLIIGAGIVASLIPDLMYLRDNFDQRMNTVFKLYYQAWTLLSIGTAYAVYAIFTGLPQSKIQFPSFKWRAEQLLVAAVFLSPLVLLLLASLTYPYFGLKQHYLLETGRVAARDCEGDLCRDEAPVTLDGGPTLISAGGSYLNRPPQALRPQDPPPQVREVGWQIGEEEYEVMQCLRDRIPYGSDAVLLEASGGGYDPAMGRFSMYTGIPTLLGWDNHQGQWRGENFFPIVYESGRLNDIHLVYEATADEWEGRVQPIIDRYGIDYVVVGKAERLIYSNNNLEPLPGIEKFALLFDPVCEAGQTAVYRVSPE